MQIFGQWPVRRRDQLETQAQARLRTQSAARVTDIFCKGSDSKRPRSLCSETPLSSQRSSRGPDRSPCGRRCSELASCMRMATGLARPAGRSIWSLPGLDGYRLSVIVVEVVAARGSGGESSLCGCVCRRALGKTNQQMRTRQLSRQSGERSSGFGGACCGQPLRRSPQCWENDFMASPRQEGRFCGVLGAEAV